MAHDKSITASMEKDANDNIVKTQGTTVETDRESDSVTLKKDSKGSYSWEIKIYGEIDNVRDMDHESMLGSKAFDLIRKLKRVNKELDSTYRNGGAA